MNHEDGDGVKGKPRRHLKWTARVAWILLACGVVGWLGGPLSCFAWKDAVRWLELPLGGPEGVAVDSAGRIYVGSSFYGRVQVYDRNGAFIRGWGVNASGGAFRIRIDESDRLHVGAARGDWHGVYDAQGNLLEESKGDGAFEQIGEESERRCVDSDGVVYLLTKARYIWPAVVRDPPEGPARTVVTSPWYLWIFMGPLPAWVVCVVGALLVLLVRAKRDEREAVRRWKRKHRPSAVERERSPAARG